MSTPAAKRRRIDAASSTLLKPFRSPFKTPLKSPLKSTPLNNSPSTPQTNPPEATKTSQASKFKPLSASLPTATTTPVRTTQNKGKKKYLSPISAAALNGDPDIAPLLRTQRELEKQLRELKEELEIAEQAQKIEAESRKRDPDSGVVDGELVELIGKWTAASRQAAEEIFGEVRDRVNRMGGPRVWKEMQKRQLEFQNSWDQEEVNNNKGGGDDGSEDEERGDVEKRDLYAEYDVDPETENEKAQRVVDTGEDPGQEDEFTMAMMLRTLNVDLKVIGYDREQQRWAD